MPTQFPESVRIVEVGPRDGLQNEAEQIPTATKLAFIEKLVAAGLQEIEVTSFVSPKAIPQLADAEELARQLPAAGGVHYQALVPNQHGLERAVESGIKRIAVFTAASETFVEKNIHMSIGRSIDVFGDVIQAARRAGLSVRAYLSTCFVCPYEGDIPAERVRGIAEQLLERGVDEVAISDTIGAASPTEVLETVGLCLDTIPVERIALHFHDTYGTALANVVAGLQLGIRTYDASAGGIGGCPFAPGATGNLATEDLVYMLERMGIATGVNLTKLADAARVIERALGRELPSRNLRRINAQTQLR